MNTYTCIQMHDGSLTYVPDTKLTETLDSLNSTLSGSERSATVYSVSGLTLEEAEETCAQFD